jgi:hypothetical protein
VRFTSVDKILGEGPGLYHLAEFICTHCPL